MAIVTKEQSQSSGRLFPSSCHHSQLEGRRRNCEAVGNDSISLSEPLTRRHLCTLAVRNKAIDVGLQHRTPRILSSSSRFPQSGAQDDGDDTQARLR